jgi:tRNA threonylcarbamoyladenosine biosynthesis protein TsaE
MTSNSFSETIQTEADTVRLGGLLAEVLLPGTVIGLVGTLGSGKTRLVQAIAAAMGVDRREVTSPTFMLIQEYAGRLPLYHFDAYRLANANELLELGALELVDDCGVCLIEWADRVLPVLPADYLRIEIAVAGPASRTFQFTAFGPQSQSVLDAYRSRVEHRGQQLT